MTPTTFAATEGFKSHEIRRKRLGQYFSGLPVSKLLVALAARHDMRTVVDPMVGKADMLVASKSVLPNVTHVDGIEVDPLAHGDCKKVLRQLQGVDAQCFLGSAFDWTQISALRVEGYDLCATNPPYVRYQAQREGAGSSARLPSATEVRTGLVDCIKRMQTLSPADRDAFLVLAEHYSGLSDLAVPSWILCAALVKVGGTLAMVVPDAWLNRDYASVVQYLLARWFRVEYIVEDAHAAWFPDAQVKTTLLVARRIPARASVSYWDKEEYLHMVLPSSLATADSLVGRSDLGNKKQPELGFAKMAASVLKGSRESLLPGVLWHKVKIADKAAAAVARGRGEEWFRCLEPEAPANDSNCYFLPPVLAGWFGDYRDFTNLSEIGVEVGQGLRTGANEFFYAEVTKVGAQASHVRLSKLFDSASVSIPSACVPRVVRKQSDLPEGFAIDPAAIKGVALAFHGWALPEDAGAAKAKPLPHSAADHIRVAARTSIDGPGSKLLPLLTAVSPNVRASNGRTGAPARFWYMLPDFAPRHRPDLFIARVNAQRPRILLNPNRTALVDANFSTVWVREKAVVSPYALLAFLNSSVAALLFEHLGSVMGGGALKLESTHVRTMPVPRLSPKCWQVLDVLGKKLAEAGGEKVLRRIDAEVCKAMFGADEAADKVTALHNAISQRQSARSKHHDTISRKSGAAVPH